MNKDVLALLIVLSCADICGNHGYDGWFTIPKDKHNCYCLDKYNRDGSIEFIFNATWSRNHLKQPEEETESIPDPIFPRRDL